jgi:hypothetical protein
MPEDMLDALKSESQKGRRSINSELLLILDKWYSDYRKRHKRSASSDAEDEDPAYHFDQMALV